MRNIKFDVSEATRLPNCETIVDSAGFGQGQGSGVGADECDSFKSFKTFNRCATFKLFIEESRFQTFQWF